MTLKGKQNHYNVKLLSGYGLSVKLKENRLVLTNGYDPFTKEQEKEEWFVTQFPYEKLVVSGKGYISFEAVKLLNEHNTNIVLTDSYGKPVSFMNGCMESMTGTTYRIGQYDTFRNLEKSKYLTKQIIQAKIQSQINFLKSLNRNDSKATVQSLRKSLFELSEKHSSITYFRYYSTLFDSRFKFDSRNQSALRITKRRASDPINALLNYGYAVLAGEISKFVNGIGLDAYFGFNHKSHTGFQPLVYDIIEPFRWLVDSTVYQVANTKDWRMKLRFKHYAWTRNGQVVLSYEIKRIFLEKLERNFQKERDYFFRHGRTRASGLSKCQEITIAKIAVQNLADYCIGKQNSFSI